MAKALTEAAKWVNCDNIVLERVNPPELAPRLRSALVGAEGDAVVDIAAG
jgi:hypothetical protein